MDEATDRDALLRVLATGGATEPRRRLLQAHGSAAAAPAAGRATWRACGLDQAQRRALGSGPGQLRSRDWLAEPRHHRVGGRRPDYPDVRRTAPAPPLALFIAGDAALLWHPAVAVVGSRSPTAGG